MRALILLLTIHLFQSCAPSPETPTSVKVSFGAATVDFPGGIYVIGKHRQSGAKFSHELSTNQIDLNLINGTWDFIAVGWEGGSNFTGNIKCGKSLGKGLNGTPVQVDLTLESGECMGVAGSINPANNEPLPYKVHSCGIFARRKQYTSPDADLVQLCDEVEGNHKSFKLVWYSFNESRYPFGSKYASRKTACVNTTNGIATFTEKLPLMNNSWGFPVTIEGYKQTSCSGTMEEIHFPNGLMSQTVKGATSPDGTNIHAMVSDNVCVGDELTNNTTYANGLAAGGSPAANTLALICNKDQFAMMANNAVHNLRFILGKDIDLSGISAFNIGTDTDPFTGDFNGLGFKVKNYSITETITSSRGLFNYVQSAKIKNLKLENIDFDFTLNGSNNFGAGLLIGTLFGRDTGTTDDSIIEDINIDNTSSLTVDNGTFNVSNYLNYVVTGALIGEVDRTAFNEVEEIRIRNIKSYAPVSNSTTAPNEEDSVGGLIGSTDNVTGSNARLTLMDNRVDANVSGGQGVGGIIGSSSQTEIGHGHSYNGTITGAKNVGGLIGYAEETKIFNSNATVTITPVDKSGSTPSIDAHALGGITGYMTEASVINGCVSNLVIDSSETFFYVGGISGYMTTTSQDAHILNSRAELKVDMDGDTHGGIVGKAFHSNLTPTTPHIYSSSAVGHIKQKISGGNNVKGGVVGYLKGKIRMIIADVDVTGNSGLGGVVGSSEGFIDEILTKGNVTSTTALNSAASSVIGNVMNPASSNIMENIIATGHVYVPSGVCLQGTNACGRIVGNAPNTLPASNHAIVKNILTLGSVYANGSIDASAPYCGGSTGNGNDCDKLGFSATQDGGTSYTNYIFNTVAATFSSDLISTFGSLGATKFLDDTGTLRLIFEKKSIDWAQSTKTLFGVPGTVYYKTGSFASPEEAFSINNTSEWNSIGTDLFLMSKSFILKSDLDFGNNAGNFTPIGNVSNRFKGVFIPNGYKLKNILLAPTGTTAGLGVFNFTGDTAGMVKAIIGLPHDPVIVENLVIQTSTHNVQDAGFIGSSYNTQISAKVQGTFSGANANYYAHRIGGIVGNVLSSDIINSSFSGTIDMGVKGQVVGGIVGKLAQTSAAQSSRIINSKVKTHLLTGNLLIGGLVGQLYNTGSARTLVENNYVEISLYPNGITPGKIEAQETNSSMSTAAGLVVATEDTGGTTNINNNYVNLINGSVLSSLVFATTSALGHSAEGISPSGTIVTSGNIVGYDNPSVNYSNNYIIDGANSDGDPAVSREIAITDITSSLIGHPWVYNSNSGTLKLFWEHAAPPMQ